MSDDNLFFNILNTLHKKNQSKKFNNVSLCYFAEMCNPSSSIESSLS